MEDFFFLFSLGKIERYFSRQEMCDNKSDLYHITADLTILYNIVAALESTI